MNQLKAFIEDSRNSLKDKASRYVLEGNKPGRSSRTRKSSFQLTDIQIIEFNDFRDIERDLESGWLKVISRKKFKWEIETSEY